MPLAITEVVNIMSHNAKRSCLTGCQPDLYHHLWFGFVNKIMDWCHLLSIFVVVIIRVVTISETGTRVQHVGKSGPGPKILKAFNNRRFFVHFFHRFGLGLVTTILFRVQMVSRTKLLNTWWLPHAFVCGFQGSEA